MDTMPKRWSIEALLASGVQPFNDLDDEAITALAAGLGRNTALAVPIVITSDGVLIDGHQRLRALRMDGRKFIDVGDVRVVDEATAADALEWAVKLNVQRRHLTVDEKAEVARKLQRDSGWSQRKIAKLFGVSQPAVSQWLNPQPETPDKPKVTKPRPTVKPAATVLNEANRLAEELCNPELARWFTDFVADDDREVVAMRLDSIAKAMAKVAAAVIASAEGDSAPF